MADTPSGLIEETQAVTSGLDDGPEEEVANAILSQEAAFQRWQARRPIIAHLKEGVATVESLGPPYKELVPLFDLNDRIVVDVRVAFLAGTPWLHTLVGKVRSIDDESGVIRILDEETNTYKWVSFRDGLHDIRIAPTKGNPFLASAARVVKPVIVTAKDGNRKRGRGRPKGSKNRSKDEILAEREAYRRMRDEKKQRRKR